MQIYRSRKEVAALKWDGTEETLDIIRNEICPLCDGLTIKRGYITNGVANKDILFINHIEGTGVGSYYNIGDYIVFDSKFLQKGISKYKDSDYRSNPFKRYTEEELNAEYEKGVE